MMVDRMARLQALIRREGWTGFWITQEATLAWVFGGRFHVNWATETGIAALAVTPNESVLYVDNIKAERLS
ncbi:MAG: aminopeptidase P family N-terminal domain-containing protein, partial [Sulfobacillus sp.]|nr:aminopeptidase P family N-terminal domain-containing protein [Sulfobacillus sp.]